MSFPLHPSSPRRNPAFPTRRLGRRFGALALAAAVSCALPDGARAEPITLKMLGGLAGVSQYSQIEKPFWTDELPALSKGRLAATIQPFDRSGVRAEEMLQLMRLGVVGFGTVPAGAAAGEEPEMDAMDLPGLNPSIDHLRDTVRLYRDHLRDILRTRYGVELLGIYVYPAQVTYCRTAFTGLDDLAGRRVRTSSIGQSDMMRALGAVTMVIPFSDVVRAVSTGVVDCAITGTMSGNEVGLDEVTTHVHAMAVSWGVSIFGASKSAWESLPPDLRDTLREATAELEGRIWAAAERETAHGLDCNVGRACNGRRGRMTLVPVSPRDEIRRRQLLTDAVLPGWIRRCGTACASAWNTALAPTLGLAAKSDPGGP